jgi:hypothetical protein
MNVIIKYYIMLAVFSCAYVAIGENILEKIDFSKDNKAINDNILKSKVLKIDKGYNFYQLRLNNVNNGLEINIKASARNGAKLGIILFRVPRPGKFEKVKQYWNVKFPDNKLDSKDFRINYSKDMKMLNGNYRLHLYRSSKKGELFLSNISVKESDSREHLEKELNETYFDKKKPFPKLKKHPFLFSVFMYHYFWKSYAKESKMDYFEVMDEQFSILRKHGVNALNISVGDQKDFSKLLKLVEKHNLVLFLQLDFAYFRPNWTDKQMRANAERAAKFISKYKDHPNVMSFSVKEEVALKDVKKLSKYYKMILAKEPNAPLQIIFNYLAPAKALPEPYPAYIGTDRYGFFFTGSGGGYLASPIRALNWTRTQAHKYYIEAARRNSEFFLVTTANALTAPGPTRRYCIKSDFEKYISNKSAAKKKQLQTLHKKYLELAERNLLGWKKFTKNGKIGYSYWRWYRPPAICVKAMAWISVLEGAKMFGIWSYHLYSEEILKTTTYEASAFGPPKQEAGFCTIAGRPGMPNPQFKAYAEVAKEIMPYSKIIMNMVKLKGSPLFTKTKNMFIRAYRHKVIDGYIVLVYNNHIGTWPENKNIYLSANTTLKLDNQGSIIDFIPEVNSRDVIMRKVLPLEGYSVFDISKNKEIFPTGGDYEQKVMPGTCKLLFVGTAENANKLYTILGKKVNDVSRN